MSQDQDHRFDRVLRELDEALEQRPQFDGPGVDPVRPEVPGWGHEAAEIIVSQANERALHIEKFGASVVHRAQEWCKLAHDLAKNIRETAEKEAEAIRRETARMLKAGNRIEVAMKEFMPEPEKSHMKKSREIEEKGNGRSEMPIKSEPAPAFLRQRPV